MKINSEKLTSEIQKDLLEMKRYPYIENSAFAVHEDDDIQIQVCLTRDKDEHINKVISGILNEKHTSSNNPELLDIATRMAQELQDMIDEAERAGCKNPLAGTQALLDEWETAFKEAIQ